MIGLKTTAFALTITTALATLVSLPARSAASPLLWHLIDYAETINAMKKDKTVLQWIDSADSKERDYLISTYGVKFHSMAQAFARAHPELRSGFQWKPEFPYASIFRLPEPAHIWSFMGLAQDFLQTQWLVEYESLVSKIERDNQYQRLIKAQTGVAKLYQVFEERFGEELRALAYAFSLTYPEHVWLRFGNGAIPEIIFFRTSPLWNAFNYRPLNTSDNKLKPFTKIARTFFAQAKRHGIDFSFKPTNVLFCHEVLDEGAD